MVEPVLKIVREEDDLVTLANKINHEHSLGEQLVSKGIEHYYRAGKLLIDAKGKCRHGRWLKWLKENIKLSQPTVWRYMQLGKLSNLNNLEEEWKKICGTVASEDETVADDKNPEVVKKQDISNGAKAGRKGGSGKSSKQPKNTDDISDISNEKDDKEIIGAEDTVDRYKEGTGEELKKGSDVKLLMSLLDDITSFVTIINRKWPKVGGIDYESMLSKDEWYGYDVQCSRQTMKAYIKFLTTFDEMIDKYIEFKN